MRAPGVVKAEVATDRGAGLGNRIVGSEIHLLILHRAPDALNEDVGAASPLRAQVVGVAVLEGYAGEGVPGDLAALMGVKAAGPAGPGAPPLNRFDKKPRLHGDR